MGTAPIKAAFIEMLRQQGESAFYEKSYVQLSSRKMHVGARYAAKCITTELLS